ncbi:Carboxylic ester hydrolase protein [Rutstroemia sp. NJR-2017a BBW]|nr:Carboxylic ester hydrolase protein [Rutstroemia sp. NJR-2017a BBW]
MPVQGSHESSTLLADVPPSTTSQPLEDDDSESIETQRYDSTNGLNESRNSDLETRSNGGANDMIEDGASDQAPRPGSGKAATESKLLQQYAKSRLCTTFRIWSTELLSLLVAALSLVALVLILSLHQGQPRPQWPYKITVNALISVFIALFKAALLFAVAEGTSQLKWLLFKKPHALADMERIDRVSRGAWGSALNFGAFLTILGLLVDPVSQQIIQDYTCLRNVSNAINSTDARAPRTQTFDTRQRLGPLDYSLVGFEQVAAYNGLMGSPTSSSESIKASCSTGNCTFPAFQSLAMCRSCSDISSTISSNNESGFWNMSLASGATIGAGTLMMTTENKLVNATVFTFDGLLTRIAGWNPVSSAAYRCSLFPCIKSYEASVTNGVYSEREVGVDINLTYVDLPKNGFALATNLTLSNTGSFISCNATPYNTSDNTIQIRTDTMTPYDDPFAREYGRLNASTSPAMWYPTRCFWRLGAGFTMAMHSFLFAQISDSWVEILHDYNSLSANETGGDPWTTQLFKEGQATQQSFESFMDGLAWSITGAMRQKSLDSSDLTFVHGQAQREAICIKVRWAWISLAAAVLGLAVLFLCTVIVTAHRSMDYWWQGDWKSSSLALMWHGLDDSAVVRQRHELEKSGEGLLVQQKDLYQSAKRIRVKLIRGDNGWRFSEQ